MKKTLLTLTMGALMLAAVPAEARWGHRGMNRGQMKGKRMEMLKATLQLTDGQVQQIKAIHTDARNQAKAYRAQIKPLRLKMQTLLKADTINEAQVVALHQRIRSLRQIVGEQRFQTRLKVMRVLTKEQRAKLMELRGKRFGKRFGKRGWGKQGRSAL